MLPRSRSLEEIRGPMTARRQTPFLSSRQNAKIQHMAIKLSNYQAIKLNKGQAMILAVLALGGAILGATTIAGLLMTYQIHQTTDFANSAKAIFAADSGVECGLYNFAGPAGHSAVPCPDPSLPLANGATYTETTDLSSQTIYSEGVSASARRAFLVLLESATTTFP